mgnify:CR=1 FL=1
MKEIVLDAYGKINIGLDVTGRRDDGYHLVRMIMQTVDISDQVRVSAREGSGRISISCDNAAVPEGEGNIAFRAARLVMDRYGIMDDIFIDIRKNIPMAAGMAGGSTDAAAVIRALDKLYDIDMPQGSADEIALKLGADVPFCLRRGTWLSEGIGEKLTRIDDMPDAHVLIVNPGFEVSTAGVYKALDAEKDPEHPDIDTLMAAIGSGSMTITASYMGNILETVTEGDHPEIGMIKKKMLEYGAAGSMMTGSGPTVFGLFEREEDTYAAMQYFKGHLYDKCFVTHFIY